MHFCKNRPETFKRWPAPRIVKPLSIPGVDSIQAKTPLAKAAGTFALSGAARQKVRKSSMKVRHENTTP